VISEYAVCRINDSQDLLQAGETKDSAGGVTMLVSVLLGTHRMYYWPTSEPS
jgi:hypothetical protein